LFNQLKVTHKDKVLPTPGMKIDDAQLQRNAFFQDEAINRIRSKIFIAALKLHQAWVASAYHSDSFRQAIYRIKDVLRGYDCEDSKPIWQLLFMLVPVVSTTFASFSRMFKSLKAGDLGWLMIDEAGQAVPQAAVGGIWRAKRVLVVGDPQQIEPVFTTAPKLTQSICQGILASDAPHWDPRYWSVQQICDRANAYGCQLNVMNQQQWIGIPLWVHRRCIEPMFSIANTIAYDNRMIHGSPTEQITALEHHVLGSNHWQVSQGVCSFKQYKNELGQDTLALLLQLIGKKCDLNDVYVITPFRAVKQQLINHIDNHRREICQMAGLTLKEYYQWRQKHIGTVHTFQGKENKTVILVLGCDSQNTGGANWAASKPNLLNVALTRAKRNIFVVGDPYVWRNRRYFSQLADKLVFVT
jgi:superfamily I DNA and/or RNA helicase